MIRNARISVDSPRFNGWVRYYTTAEMLPLRFGLRGEERWSEYCVCEDKIFYWIDGKWMKWDGKILNIETLEFCDSWGNND